MKKRKTFTDSEIGRMERLYLDPSIPLNEIADLLGCKVQTITKRAKKLGWFSPQLSKDRRRQARPSQKGIDIGSEGRAAYAEQMFVVHKQYQINDQRQCTRCGETLKLDQFRPLPPKQQRYLERGVTKRLSHCNSCERIRTAAFKSKKSETIEGTASFLMSNVRRRVREKKLKCEIDTDWIINTFKRQNGNCFYSGQEMTLLTDRQTVRRGGGYKKNRRTNISIDRINPSFGYLKNNTVLCCWLYNNLKQDLEIRAFLDAISDINDRRNLILDKIAKLGANK